jgi:DNA-binding transcriptional regulator LsrR (DeoR family)
MSSSELMAQVAHYYYRSHLTMAQIAARLGMSRHRVGRLLKAAIATGVVKIEIRSPIAENAELRRALEETFRLKAARVVEVAPGASLEQTKHTTCTAAAPFLRELLRTHRMIGVGWGSTTFELINALEPLALHDATVVQITGGNKRLSMQFDCHEVTRRLAQKLHVQPILLHAPGIVDDRRTRELLVRDSAVADTFRYFGKLDLAIIGIGALRPTVQSTLISSGYISAAELKAVMRAGAVGDVFSYFFNADGEVVRTEIYERLITIGLADIRKIPTTVGVATGAVKAQAVAAAIRGGFVNTLIVDSALARAILTQETRNLGRRKRGPSPGRRSPARNRMPETAARTSE